MRVVLQRVRHASVSVDGERISEIGPGLLALLGVAAGDAAANAEALARKTVALRLFADGDRPFHLAVGDIGGEVLVVSQFTLHGDVRKGNRPSWAAAAHPDIAEPLVQAYTDALVAAGVRTQSGRFGANMQVELLNDGPVTMVIDTEEWSRPRRA